MPRGNDTVEAARELAERYGTTGNAEDLVQSARLTRNKTLQTASLLPINEQATDDLDSDAVAKEADVDEVVSFAVRGQYVVYLFETEDGRIHKGVYPLPDSKAAKKAEEAGEPRQRGVEVAARRRAALKKAAAEAEAEVAQKTAEAEAEARENAAKKVEQETKKTEKDSSK